MALTTSFTLPRFDANALQRLLRKGAVDRVILGAKILCGLFSLLCLAAIAKETLRARARVTTADLSFKNEIIAPSAPAVFQSSNGGGDFSLLIRKPLLGSMDAPVAPVAAVKPISNIALALIGVYVEEGEVPFAIIEDQKKKVQDVFNIGEQIFGEAKLVKIGSESVDIERAGKIEQLVLENTVDGKPDYKGGVAALDNNFYVVEEGELEKALENLPLLLTQARAVPYFKEGVSVGLRLFAIKSGSMFEKIGLKNGDILRSVNGNSLGDITQAMKLFETLKQERAVTVRLERSNEEKEFKYEIR